MTRNGGDEDSPAFDRRSVLKKAAVAGTIAWAAPAIISTSVDAQDGTFTPKCGATSLRGFNRFTVNGTCNAAGGADWTVRVQISIGQGDCGCSTPTEANGGLDADGPDSIGPLPLISKTYFEPAVEWTFLYQGFTETPGLFASPMFDAVLRCTDRAGDVQEYLDTGTVSISEQLECGDTG